MKLRNWIRKIKSRKGESLAEVLIALLVSVLGLVLLASMITTSVNIVTKSKKSMKEYNDAEKNLISQSGSSGTGKIVIEGGKKLTSDLSDQVTVNYYSNDLEGNRTIYTYKVPAPYVGGGD